MKSLQYRFLELNLFLKHCILCECSCYCAFEEKAGIAGNKRRHNKYTLNVKYKALMEIGRGLPTRMSRKNSMPPKSTMSTWRKNRDKIVTAFKSSGGTKSQ